MNVSTSRPPSPASRPATILPRGCPVHPYIGPVILDLLSPGVEIGLVTTNVDAMVTFYEGFLGLEPQGQIDFADVTQRRYTLGGSVLKLVTYTTPPPLPVAA